MVKVAIEVAREAGKFLKYNLGKVGKIERKKGEETNLVTDIDKQAEALIISKIRGHFPSHGILAEESGSHDTKSEFTWIIDPLDGTTNFAHGFPIFSVSIAVTRNKKVIVGVVYDPSAEELFAAERDGGAFLNGKRIHVSSTGTLVASLLVTGFPYNVRENPHHAVEHFANFLREAQGIRRLGSAALDLAYVATGRLDGYWEVFLNPWDKAAGMLLVEEAGGKVSDFFGNPGDPYHPMTLATNGKIHGQMLEVLQSSLKHTVNKN